MSEKPKKVREGDWVEIIVPRFVVRVGYPKSLDDYKKLVLENQYALIDALLARYKAGHRSDRAKERIVHELAYLAAKDDGFGGRERSLHFVEYPELAGQACQVRGIVTKMTGTYYPPTYSRGWGYSGYEDEYEPGGLAGQKCHRLYKVWPWGMAKLHGSDDLLIQPENVDPGIQR